MSRHGTHLENSFLKDKSLCKMKPTLTYDNFNVLGISYNFYDIFQCPHLFWATGAFGLIVFVRPRPRLKPANNFYIIYHDKEESEYL